MTPEPQTVDLTPAQLEKKAAKFAILANPKRLLIAACLADGPRSVTELGEMVALKFPTLAEEPQVTASHQLAIMRLKKMVLCRRYGAFVYYELSPGIKRFAQSLLNCIGVTEEFEAKEGAEAESSCTPR